LRQLVGNGISTFSGSVDKGRDAVFNGEATSFPSESDHWSGAWIFQVKHRTYSSRGAEAVRAELRRSLPEELRRILYKHNHNCENYVVVTNCPLTAQDKDALSSLIKHDHDQIKQVAVLGESDLQELLDCHPKVVSAFPQILGLSQLRELVEWGLHTRSRQYLLTAQSEIAKFVVTSPYLAAKDLLDKQHFCILSGPPKMGKTCTAYALAASFAALSYEIYDLQNQRDFFDAYQVDAKQFFVCDDVFGDIALQAMYRDDWTRGFSRLLRSLGNNHKLVWTAREYIFQEAITSSRLQEERPEIAKTDRVTVAVDQLSRLEKAMILYNHAREANLPSNVREFLRGKACISVTDHPNYSPESIRQLCTGRLVSFSKSASGNPSAIEEQIHAFLSAPGEAWKKAYSAASAGEKLLCTEVMAAGGTIRISQLKKRYENAIKDASNVFPCFEKSLASSQGTFLRRKPSSSSDDYVQFYHPSMRDILCELIQTDKATRTAYLRQLTLKELSSVSSQAKSDDKLGSESHQIQITDSEDIKLLEDHIIRSLLPTAAIADVLSLLSDFKMFLKKENGPLTYRCQRNSRTLGSTFWTILDLVMPHVCLKRFWQNNSKISDVVQWRRLFEILRLLLPLSSTPSIPEYIPELLGSFKVDRSVDYWGLVSAVHQIVPTIVEQCVDMREREVCRRYLAEEIERAIQNAESLSLEDNFDDSQYWYDEFGSVAEKCEDYAVSYPDDTSIPGVEKVMEIIDKYPLIEEEQDEDHESASMNFSSFSSDLEIHQIFSDL